MVFVGPSLQSSDYILFLLLRVFSRSYKPSWEQVEWARSPQCLLTYPISGPKKSQLWVHGVSWGRIYQDPEVCCVYEFTV